MVVDGALSESSTSESMLCRGMLCRGMPSEHGMGKIDCSLSKREGSITRVELSVVALCEVATSENTLSAGMLGKVTLSEGSAPTGSDIGKRRVSGSNLSKRSESTSSAVDSMPLVLCSSERMLSMRIPRCGESGGLGGSASRKRTSHGGALHGVTLSEGTLHSTLSAGDVSIGGGDAKEQLVGPSQPLGL